MKNKKRLVAIAMAAMMTAGALTGCGASTSSDSSSDSSSGSAAAASTGTETSYKIAWCNNSSADDYQVALTAVLEATAEENGAELVEFDAQGDTQTQTNQIEQAISQGVDAIIITCNDAVGVGEAVKDAYDAGIPVITAAEDVGEDYQEYRTSYVGVDDIVTSTLVAEQMIEAFPDGAKVVMIEGTAGNHAQMQRTEGFTTAIEGSNIELLDSQACSAWDANESMKIMEDFIVKYGDEIDGVFVQWDVGANGAIQAIEASSLSSKDLFVGSIDGCLVGVQNVRDGKADCVIAQDLDGIGQTCVETAIKAINGEEVESQINPDPVVVTADNCDEFEPTW